MFQPTAQSQASSVEPVQTVPASNRVPNRVLDLAAQLDHEQPTRRRRRKVSVPEGAKPARVIVTESGR